MKHTKLFAPVLLAAAALFFASCEDSENWQPTWAVPLVKEKKMQVGDFIKESQVTEFNQQLQDIWGEYVDEELRESGAVYGPQVVDSVAYLIFFSKNTDGSYMYVDTSGSCPRLNDATEAMLLITAGQNEVDDINQFLCYYEENPQGNVGSGNTAMEHLLFGGIVGDSKDIFVTAANVIEKLEGTIYGTEYIDKIDAQLDSVLKQANIDEFIELNISELTNGAQVSKIVIDMDIENSMPFTIKLAVSFVNADSSPAMHMFNETVVKGPSAPLPPCNKEGSDLNNAVNSATAIQLKVECKKDEHLTPAVLRTLGETGITIKNLRVKVQAGMSSIVNQ